MAVLGAKLLPISHPVESLHARARSRLQAALFCACPQTADANVRARTSWILKVDLRTEGQFPVLNRVQSKIVTQPANGRVYCAGASPAWYTSTATISSGFTKLFMSPEGFVDLVGGFLSIARPGTIEDASV